MERMMVLMETKNYQEAGLHFVKRHCCDSCVAVYSLCICDFFLHNSSFASSIIFFTSVV